MSFKNPFIEDEAICEGEASSDESEAESEFANFINDESDSSQETLPYHLIPPWEEDEEVVDLVSERELWWSDGESEDEAGDPLTDPEVVELSSDDDSIICLN